MIIGDMEVRLMADVARIQRDMDQARNVVTSAMDRIAGAINVAKAALLAFAVATGIGAIMAFVGGLKSMIAGGIEAAASLNDLSIQTGASVAALMRFREIGATSDTTVESLAGAMNKLSKNMASTTEESKGLPNALRAIGLNFADFKKLNPDQQMITVARAMDNFGDGAGKSAAAMALYGREGARMLPFLKDLAGESDAVTAALTEQEKAAKAALAAMADNFGDNLTQIQRATAQTGKAVSEGMLPALFEASTAFLAVTNQAGGLKDILKSLAADGSIATWTRNAITGLTYLADIMQINGRVAYGVLTILKTVVTQGAQAFMGLAKSMVQFIHGDYQDSWNTIGETVATVKATAVSDANDLNKLFTDPTWGKKMREQLEVAKSVKAEASKNKPQVDLKPPVDAATNKEVEKYLALLDKINGKEAGQDASFHSNVAILKQAYDAGKIGLEDYIVTIERYIKQQKFSRDIDKAAADTAENLAKMRGALNDERDAEFKAAVAEADANERAAETFGMTKTQIELLTVARMEDRLAQAAALELDAAEIAQIERVIAQKKRNAAALGTTDALEATKKAADDQIAEAKRIADSVEGSLTDALMRGFESGKGFAKNLIDTLKNMFSTLVLRPIISAIVNPVAGAVTGALGFSGAANAATSAAGSAAGSALGITGALGSIGTGAMQTAGAILSGQIGLGSTLSAGLSAIGTGSASGIMAGLSSVVGALGPIALGIGAAVALYKHFDTGGTNHSGGAASASSSGVSAVDSSYIGFHLPERNAQADAMTAGLASGIVGILDSTALAFGKTAGYTAATAFADDTSKDGAWGALLINKLGEKVVNWQDTQSSRWAPKEFADGAAGQAQYLAALSASVRTALDNIGLPGWATKMLDSVGAGASIEDLAKVVDQINKTQSALKMMGDSLAGFAALSDKAVTTLIEASGGIDALASNASAYYDAFYTETEKSASTIKAITDVLAGVGVAMPATKEAFRATVEAQMALGEAGAPAVAALLKVAGAFSQAVPAIEAAGAATQSTSEIMSQRADLQKQFDQATMTSAQLRAKERLAIDASNLALFDQITNLQTIAATSDALKTSIDKLKTFKDGILSFRDSLTLGSLSTLNPMQKAAEAQRQYEDMLAKAQAGDETARAGIQGAATAYLTADQIVKASSDAYVNDAMQVQADLMALADAAGAQISVDQLQLTALDSQVAGIASLNAEVKGLREDNAKLLTALERQTAAVEDQTAAVVTVTLQAADSNAEKVNSGTQRAATSRNYKLNLEAEATAR